jgi:nondiscriminating aspartyl-tRNA synthetase
MARILIGECLQKIGAQVTVAGWVNTVRSHGKIAFFDLRDRSGILQIGAFGKELASQVAALNQQDVVEVTGLVKKREERYINAESPTGTIELELISLTVIVKSAEMPFDMAGKELELQLPTLLDYRSLTLRHSTISAIFKVQAAILAGFRKAAESLGCTEIVVPTIAASSTEGGAEVFMVDYYTYKAFMTQSPQLYKQMLVPVFERVYTIAHAYRAEPSVTTRHLSETTQMDCEFGFVEFEDLLDLLETVISETLKYAEKESEDILRQFGIERISFGKIPRLTLRQAQEIIFTETGRDNRTEKDLEPQDEVDICAWALKTHGSDLVTITHFPTSKRAFYTKPDPKDPEYSLSYDVLFRGVEISSGSQRINDYTELVDVIKKRGMDPKNFALYLQAFQYGMPPEGGFSFGLERITMHMLNLANVRQASLYPRDMERVDERLSVIYPNKKHVEKKE